MSTLFLKPVSAGYSAQQRSGVLAVELDGGSARYRRDVLHGSFRVSVTWVCTEDEYDYLCAFYRTATVQGSLPFEITLRIDGAASELVTAYFVPDSFRLTGVEDRLHRVQAELEVQKPFDAGQEAADTAIIEAFEAAHGVPP